MKFAPAAALTLCSYLYPRWYTARCLRQCLTGQHRSVVCVTQMRRHQMLQPPIIQIRQQCRCLSITEMAQGSAHTRLERGGIRAALQHVAVMIAFEHECIAAIQQAPDMRGDAPGIREHPEAVSAIGKNKLDRFTRVMRYRHRRDAQVTQDKIRVRIKSSGADQTCSVTGRQGACRAPHGKPVACGESRHAAYMVRVLMGDQHGGKVFRRDTETGKTHRRFCDRKAAIHHDTSATRLNQRGVAAAAASE